MNKAIRIISILMLVVLIVGAFTLPTLASGVDLDSFTSNSSANTDGITNLFGSIISIVQVIGTGIAIIMLIVIAIKYLVASPEGKGELKKSALIYVVSAFILFAAVNILAVIQDWTNDLDFV